jgi:large conductance mechanosensitive channel
VIRAPDTDSDGLRDAITERVAVVGRVYLRGRSFNLVYTDALLRHTMGLLSEFKEFTVKGNFIDLAVGVIIGAASGKVVSTLVEKVIMPPIGLVLGKVNFADLKIVLQHGTTGPDGKELVKEVAIGYGAAFQSLIDFLIIGFIVFLVVRLYNKIRATAPPPPQPPAEKLLTEIRDLLTKKS